MYKELKRQDEKTKNETEKQRYSSLAVQMPYQVAGKLVSMVMITPQKRPNSNTKVDQYPPRSARQWLPNQAFYDRE